MAASDIAHEDQIDSLAAKIAAKHNALKGNVGDLASLTTTAKASIVAALNEVKASIPAAGAVINDSATSGSSTWSSTKVNSAISAAVTALITGAPGALDTLDELAAALGDDANFAATMTTALGNRIRYDAAQALTGPQKTQALANLGLVMSTADFAAAYEAAVGA